MEKRVRFSIWYFLAAFAVVLALQAYLTNEQVTEISYAEFKQLVDAGKVTDVVVSPDYVSGKLTTLDLEGILQPDKIAQLKQWGGSSHSFRAVKVDDPKLIETLEARKIPFSGHLPSTWLANLASWALSVVFFLVLWGCPVSPHGCRRRRRLDGDRAQQGQGLRRERDAGDLRRRRRHRRGQGGAARGGRVPAHAGALPPPGREDSERRAAGGRARHRQDAAGARRRRRSQGAVLQHERLGVRRDVRRRRRGARARPVRAGEAEGAVHHLHRRARRARQVAQHQSAGHARRARADAEPAAGGDGRLRSQRRRDHHGGDQPAGDPRCGAAARRALRPARRSRPPRRARPRGHPAGACADGEARSRTSTSRWWRRGRPASSVPIWPTW